MNTINCQRSDDIVISGIAGRFPECTNVEEFKENLYNHVDMVNDDPRRFPCDTYLVPNRMGKLKDADLCAFDCQFFGILPKMAQMMDPQIRLSMEVAYESIIDAGVNPVDIRGTMTGVYVAVCSCDADYLSHKPVDNDLDDYDFLRSHRSAIPNFVSFALDLRGPSYLVDTACASSLYALTSAVANINEGRCENAIIIGSNMLLHPITTQRLAKLHVIAKSGKCKSFDNDCDGYVRSDSVCAIFLQKSSTAKRAYANVLNVSTLSSGYSKNGIFLPSSECQMQLLKSCFESINLDPKMVGYVEAHSPGTKAGDMQETDALRYLYNNRDTPLLIGSVKTNMGHAEAAAGMTSIIKMIFSMETGVIPANLHFKTPNLEITGIREGKLKVVSENTPWDGKVSCVNSYGIYGTNGHAILHGNQKVKKPVSQDALPFPRLAISSGRTSSSVRKIFKNLESNQNDEEFIGLVNGIFEKNIPYHPFRGYSVLGCSEMYTQVISETDLNRPIWFMYSGLGSQWETMGQELMNIEICRKSICKTAEYLKPNGIDLIDLLVRGTKNEMLQITNIFITIAAIQIALTDLLNALGITPDGILGHSMGEISAGYGDGCLTAEQVIMANYYKGKCITDANLPSGAMAAIEMPADECRNYLPSDSYIIARNTPTNVTIAGPTTSITNLVTDLRAKGIKVAIVNTGGCAFHTKYLEGAVPQYLTLLNQLIPNPKKISKKWISTSVSDRTLSKDERYKFCGPDYILNNFMSPILFLESIQKIPSNAIFIEIAPHGLMQRLIRQSLGDESINISLMQKNSDKNLMFLLKGIGQLYAHGAQPKVNNLYPPVSYPVSRGTPSISPLIEWDHSLSFSVPKTFDGAQMASSIVSINLSHPSYAYLDGYKFHNQQVFPPMGLISIIWEMFAKKQRKQMTNMPIALKNIKFHRLLYPLYGKTIEFSGKFLDDSNKFELYESECIIASGRIENCSNWITGDPVDDVLSDKLISSSDIESDFHNRGYTYPKEFKCLESLHAGKDVGCIKWTNNWTVFLDSMVQFHLMKTYSQDLLYPVRIQKVYINPKKLTKKSVSVCMDGLMIKSQGIEIYGLEFDSKPKIDFDVPVLEQHRFVPYFEYSKNEDRALSNIVQIVLENSENSNKIRIVEDLCDRHIGETLQENLTLIIQNDHHFDYEILFLINSSMDRYREVIRTNPSIQLIYRNDENQLKYQNSHMLIGHNILNNENVALTLKIYKRTICPDGFILLQENINKFNRSKTDDLLSAAGLEITSIQQTTKYFYILIRPEVQLEQRKKKIIQISNRSFDWLNDLKATLSSKSNDKYVYIVNQILEPTGVIGLINSLKFYNEKFIRLIYIADQNADTFSFTNSFYIKQLKKDLKVNTLQNGIWGSYRRIKCPPLHLNDCTTEHAIFTIKESGEVRAIESPLSAFKECSDNEEFCKISYASVDNNVNGSFVEFSGLNSNGLRIMGLSRTTAFATTCLANKKLIWKIPELWSMEDGATVPYAYYVAFYVLVVQSQLKKNDKILIVNGNSSVGIATISVAYMYGLQIFVTVDSIEKKNYLLKVFDKLQGSIFLVNESTSVQFVKSMVTKTNGKGVDLIFSYMCNDHLDTLIKCLKFDGRLIYVGSSKCKMFRLKPKRTISIVFIDPQSIFDDQYQDQISELLNNALKSDSIKPIKRLTFEYQQVSEAIKYSESKNTIGKSIMLIQHIKSNGLIEASPRIYFDEHKSYIVVADHIVFGLQLVKWLVSRGALNIIYNSSNYDYSGYELHIVEQLKTQGVSMLLDNSDLSQSKNCSMVIDVAQKLGALGGIFIFPRNYDRMSLDRLNEDVMLKTIKSNVLACEYLNTASKLTPQLDHFVYISSYEFGYEGPNSLHLAYAFSIVERILESRHTDGLPSKFIQFRHIDYHGNCIDTSGMKAQSILSCLETLDFFLKQSSCVVGSSFVKATKIESQISETSEVGLLKIVADILSIKDVTSISDSSTFIELGIDSFSIKDIQDTLKDKINVEYSAGQVRELTFGMLKKM